MTDLLLMWVSAGTVNCLFGSISSERKMIRKFGEAYQKYQEEVQRLIPGLKLKR